MAAPRSRRILIWLAAIIVAVPAVGALGALIWWARGLPHLEGDVRLPGLAADVRIVRDKFGVPHIFASSLKDAARALGYLHAQDRFFQMDVTRRVLQGRISEAVGPVALNLDKLNRALDLAGRARDSLAALSPELRDHLTAYAEGVNSWLTDSGQGLPLEYALLGMEPEPWRAEDSVLWGKGMAWKLSANWRQDAARAMVAEAYGQQRAERLFPPKFPEWPVTLKPEITRIIPQNPAQQGAAIPGRQTSVDSLLMKRLLELPASDAGASNEWVVAGARTVSGKPILANDPHLEFGIPILWYLVRINTPELTVAGATAPGVPLVLLGQNSHIAWGFTTTDSDAQDLFIETPSANNPGHYDTPSGPQPIRVETVVIKVKGAEPVPFTRRETHHGPVISDAVADAKALAGGDKMVSLAWNGLGRADTSAEAFYRMNRARNWQEFQDALRLHQSPTQNIVYADREGNIGFMNAGEVPVRKSGDGRYPANGATGDGDWTGVVPFKGWPSLYNPPAGAIVNANNANTDASYPHWFGRDQTAGYRAMRIIERLSDLPKHDVDTMGDIQLDTDANHARDLLPFLLKLQPETEQEEEALFLLRDWDHNAQYDRPEALILDWWLLRMNEELLKSGLEPVAPTSGSLNASVVVSILRTPDGFCGRNGGATDCMDAVRAAFKRTLAELTERYGADPSDWRWGDEHVAIVENQVLDKLPGFRTIFGQAFPSDGGFYSINRGGNLGRPEPERPLARKSGAGYRGLYDLADPSRSRFVIATGQSEHPLSPFYADQLPLYRAGEGIRLFLTDDELDAENSGELVLKP
jgi:penicillin amidase